MTFAETEILPESPYYLIHPILNKLILDANKEYHIDKTVIVGDRREWKIVKKKLNPKNTKEKTYLSENSGFPYISELESEIGDIFKSVYQKERKDDISEANSKTLTFLKHKMLDICTSSQEINWLDIGCGDGRCLEILDEIHHEGNINYHGIDSSYKYFDDAEKRASEYNITAKFNKLNADNIDFDSKYDLISAILFLHEVDPLRLPYILRNMLRALKEDGTIVISDFEGPYEQEQDVVSWNAEDIRQLLGNFGKIGMSINFNSAEKYPNELGFYQCFIKKEKFNEENFNDLIDTYGDFLESKKEESKKTREVLRNEIEKRISEILKRNDIDTKNINNKEKKRIQSEIEEEYGIKAHKIKLLTNQILFLDNKINEINIAGTNL
jgi:ubiquinone/menaquinone biosynthesis C-methylase UbiE